MALAIFARWLVPVHRASYRWFMDGWAERAVNIIVRSLEPKWRGAVVWPLRQIASQQLSAAGENTCPAAQIRLDCTCSGHVQSAP